MAELKPIKLDYNAIKPPSRACGFGGAGLPFWVIPLQIPWYFAAVVGAWFVLGDPEPTRTQLCEVFLVVSFPAIFGAIWEVALILTLIAKRTPVDKPSLIVAILALIACSLEVALIALAIRHG